MTVSERGIVLDEEAGHRKVARDRVGVLLAERLQLVACGTGQRPGRDLVGDLGDVPARSTGISVIPTPVRAITITLLIRLPVIPTPVRAITITLLIRLPVIPTPVRAVTITLLIRLPVIPTPVRAITITLLIRLPVIPTPVRAITITLLIRLPVPAGGGAAVVRGIARATRALAIFVFCHQLILLLTRKWPPCVGWPFPVREVRRCPTLPQGVPCSTIGAERLS
ncbi:hypothetical protein R2Q81_14225, partial [Microbacterium aquimaris]|uniref:hypothetical protein n=1 Tax=Microbacterium aquimaris TaxID=459816 RepID=UPI002AD4C50D